MDDIETVYKVLLSESERDLVMKLLTDHMLSIPNVHESGPEYLKAWETLNEVKIASEFKLNNKMGD